MAVANVSVSLFSTRFNLVAGFVGNYPEKSIERNGVN
jgi:hypothetical protein